MAAFGSAVAHLKLDPFPTRPGAYFDYLAGELDADGLR